MLSSLVGEHAPLHGDQREELTEVGGWGAGNKTIPFTCVNSEAMQPCFPITRAGAASMPGKAGAVEMVKAGDATTATERNADQTVCKQPVCQDLHRTEIYFLMAGLLLFISCSLLSLY